MFNCLTKLAKLECLKNFGKILATNSSLFLTTKLSPFSFQSISSWLLESFTIVQSFSTNAGLLLFFDLLLELFPVVEAELVAVDWGTTEVAGTYAVNWWFSNEFSDPTVDGTLSAAALFGKDMLSGNISRRRAQGDFKEISR